MALEIERKFLVTDRSFIQEALRCAKIHQYYLPEENVGVTRRIRFMDQRAYLTQKGRSSCSGWIREEEEREISLEEARAIQQTSTFEGEIEKTRYYIPYEGFLWEVDLFHGSLDGLIIAEVELSRVEDFPPLPPWIGAEVTGDARYYNSVLSRMCQDELRSLIGTKDN